MKEIVLRQVTKTSNYNLFVMHEQNRAVVGKEGGFKPRKDLLESMKKHGFMESGHIICATRGDGKLTIIDGHNRFVTAKHLGLPIWYVAHPEYTVPTPVEHSVTAKSWGASDVARGYAHSESDYAEVIAFHERTNIPMLACFSMFGGQIASSGNMNPVMKRGKFRIKTRDYPLEVARVVEAMRRHCDFASSHGMVTAISRAYFANGFSIDRMIERINRKPELLTKKSTVAEYEELLELIYNHAVKGDRLYLRTEIEKSMRARNRAAIAKAAGSEVDQ